MRSQGKRNSQFQPSGPSSEASIRDHLYAVKARGEQESSPDVVIGLLQVFSFNVYALHSPGATLSFVTPLVGRMFDVLLDVLIRPFYVCTPMGDTLVAKRVNRKCHVMLPNRVILVDLLEHDMFDFDLILGMDLLHDCFASIDCRTRVVKF